MLQLWRPLLILLTVGSLASACDPCGKLAKSLNIADIDSAAYCYLQRKQYESASLLLEQLMVYYKGTQRAPVIMFEYANTKFKTGQYITAAYFYNQFNQQYPNHILVEESSFRIAECFYSQSAEHQLDQTETYQAIEYLQLFANQYPNSSKLGQTTEMLAELRNKLAYKAFENANLYLKTSKFKAAVVAFKTLLNDFPDSPYREEAQFKLLKAQVAYAQQSVPEKQLERFEEAREYHQRYLSRYPSGKYVNDADNLLKTVQSSIDKINTQNTPQP